MHEVASADVPTGRRSFYVWLTTLSVVGLSVSTYLWIAKTGVTELVCGTFGDCISVNFSVYADIAGIPVAFAGMAVYFVLTILSLLAWFGYESQVTIVAFTLAFAAALFSLYFTGIEAFVLRAYCVWCLISWLVITSLAVLWGRRLQHVVRENE